MSHAHRASAKWEEEFETLASWFEAGEAARFAFPGSHSYARDGLVLEGDRGFEARGPSITNVSLLYQKGRDSRIPWLKQNYEMLA